MRGGLGPASQYLESQNIVHTRSSPREVPNQPKSAPVQKGPGTSWKKDRVVVEIPRRVKFAPVQPAQPPAKEPPKIATEDVSESESEAEEDELDELKDALNQPEPEPEKVDPNVADSTLPNKIKEKTKSYKRESKLKELLRLNPQWEEMWKALLPESLLATNTAWQKNLLDTLKAKNVKVNFQQDASPTYAVFKVTAEKTAHMPEGAIVVEDPVEQFYNQTGYTGPYHVPRSNVAPENADLRTMWPLVNRSGRKESLLDGGSQIASMSLKAALELGISYDPSFTITMESADKSRTQTLGLARNVRFDFEGIIYYLQLHILKDPAYEVLLGRPFEVVSEISLHSTANGDVIATIEDPGTGKKLTCPTYKRGQMSKNLLPQGSHDTPSGFQNRSRN